MFFVHLLREGLKRGHEAPFSRRRKAVRRAGAILTRDGPHFHGFRCRQDGGMKAGIGFLVPFSEARDGARRGHHPETRMADFPPLN